MTAGSRPRNPPWFPISYQLTFIVETAMKALLIVLATALCAVAGLWVITLTSNHLGESASAPPTVAVAPVAAPEPPKPAVVEVPEPVARLESGADAEIRPALNGYVMHFKVNEGDLVQKGQLLVELGDSKLADAVTRAEAALQTAKAQLAARQVRLASAEEPSQHTLGAGHGSLALPQTEVETQKRALKADSELEQARINQAEVDLRKAKQALAQTQIVAPIAGIVAQRLSDTGELSKTDVVLMRIVDVGTVKLSLDATALGTAVTGQEAHVTVDAFPDRYFFGRVVSKMQVPGLSATSSSLCIEVGNPEKLLKPGMYAHVRLMFDRLNQPKMAAVQRSAGKATASGPASETSAAADVVATLAALTKTLGAEAQEIQRKETAARATAEATRQYFTLLERLVDELRHAEKRSRSSLERAADKIDDAPTLHVDDELLAFGVEVSKALRDIAERRRAIARVNDVPDLGYAERAQTASNAIRTQGLLEIHNGLVDMRRRLTKKYDLEFLATLTPTRSSAAMRDTRHARR
jgi:RND family efflux transporter MFP subunit